jgi:DNA-binding SARP family transcriptional activator
MNVWQIYLLGKPYAENSDGIVRLRSKKTWGVLASLLLADRQTERKDVLVRRFWADTPDRQNLRQALHSIRAAFGEACISSTTDTVSLAAGYFQCDVAGMDAWRNVADASATPESRIAYLANAADRIRGEFLAGFSLADDEDGWLGRWRSRLQQEHGALLLSLAETLEATGNPRGAFEAACRMVRLVPEMDTGWEKVLRLGQGTYQMDAVHDLARTLDLRHITERLHELESSAHSLHQKEEHLFEVAFEKRFRLLSASEQGKLTRLSVFSATFHASHARVICSVSLTDLRHFADQGLLMRLEERYSLFPLARKRLYLQETIPSRRVLLARHARHFYQWFCFGPWRPEEVEAEKAHLLQALEWFMKHPSLRALEFYYLIGQGGLTDLVDHAWAWCEALAADTTLPLPLRGAAAFGAARICIERRDFRQARRLLERAAEIYSLSHDSRRSADTEFWLALACHHSGDFTTAAYHARRAASQFAGDHPLNQGQALRFLAEIYRADMQLECAYETCTEALGIQMAHGASPLVVAETLYQLGTTEYLLGRRKEAIEHYESSLRIRFDHDDPVGQGDCLCGIAVGLLNEQRFLQAEAMLRYAIMLYRSRNAADSEAGALLVFGDVLKESGRWEEARREYARGLTFWTARDHPHWIRRFQERMDALNITG